MERILVIVAIAALSVVFLTTNNRILNQQLLMYSSEAYVAGNGFAQQLIEQISLRSFDETTTNQLTIGAPGDLTPPGNFGLDGAETVPDDIDDYHGMIISLDSPRMEGFEGRITISYADTVLPSNDYVSQTYLKRIKIAVKNDKFMTDSLVFQQLISYH